MKETLKKGGKNTPTERQQSGEHLLCRKENAEHTSEVAPSAALLQNHIHPENKQSPKDGARGGGCKQKGDTVNILPLGTKMRKTVFPKLLSFIFYFHSLLLYLHILLLIFFKLVYKIIHH